MIFYGKGVVWDKERSKPLCRFENGVFETKNTRIIRLLKETGYEGEETGKDTKK